MRVRTYTPDGEMVAFYLGLAIGTGGTVFFALLADALAKQLGR